MLNRCEAAFDPERGRAAPILSLVRRVGYVEANFTAEFSDRRGRAERVDTHERFGGTGGLSYKGFP